MDQAGEETGFSTLGKTVVVHANGFEVDSVIPGGERLKLSGTSMAAPQVTNLAAKLFALDPKLSATQVKAIDPGGRRAQAARQSDQSEGDDRPRWGSTCRRS